MKTTFFVAIFLAVGCASAVDGASVSQGGAAGADSNVGADGAGADSGMGATSSGGAGGTGGSPSSGCGPNVSEEACRSLSACGTAPVGAPSGERLNYSFFDLVTYTDEQMLARCRRYCAAAGRCGATDSSACEESCPEFVDQAREQSCEVTLLDALECIEKEVCRHGFPTPSSDAYDDVNADHPCDFRTGLVDCSIVPEQGAPEAFAHFGAGGGARYVAGWSTFNEGSACGLNLSNGNDWYDGSVKCDPGSGGLCCTCSAGGRPVRKLAMPRTCEGDFWYSEAEIAEISAACGWRF